ncbi:alpha/beta-hydrolase [Hymenopellis radicata]|nr:alpha/beta-hydrolase [Hymenopellis radicata]
MATLARPLGDCCFKTVPHEGEPKGTVEDIGGAPTYVSEPPNMTSTPKRVVLFLADVYGPMYINNKLVQDYFASQGFAVVGLDYFLGDPIYPHFEEEGWDRPKWMEKSKRQAREIFPAWLEGVKQRYGEDAKYAAVGYCFGAPFVLELGATKFTVAGAIAHPAFLDEHHFHNNKSPLMLSCAETDRTFPLDARRRAESMLVAARTKYFFQIFSGIDHGFATRGDPAIADARWAKEESASAMVRWFSRFCEEGPTQSTGRPAKNLG